MIDKFNLKIDTHLFEFINNEVLQGLDLDKEIFIDGSLGLNFAKLRNIIEILKETYCGSIGVEFVHIQDADQKQWVQERIEEVRKVIHLHLFSSCHKFF